MRTAAEMRTDAFTCAHALIDMNIQRQVRTRALQERLFAGTDTETNTHTELSPVSLKENRERGWRGGETGRGRER